MNLELFLAKRIHFNKNDGERRVSTPAVKIAIAGVAVGVAAIILSVSIVVGFKKGVRNKVIGFGSHIQIANFDNNRSYESHPICFDSSMQARITTVKDVVHSQKYAITPGIVKTDSAFEGIVLKGVGSDYDWHFFKQNLIKGHVINVNSPTAGNEIIISKNISDKLKLNVGDSFICYFIQEPIRYRKFKIAGIYNTNFEDYDKLFIIGDIRTVQKLNDWANDQISGVELLVNNYDRIDQIKDKVDDHFLSYKDRLGNRMYIRSIKDLNPMIFSWLDLLNMNVWVIIILMFAVSVFTIISGLLIIILEHTRMIGILKTLGARDFSIRKTFLYVSLFLVVRGLIWGDIISLVILFIQKYFQVIRLSPETYYVSRMPVDINLWYIILINIGTVVVAALTMIGPSYLISKISPARSVKFE